MSPQKPLATMSSDSAAARFTRLAACSGCSCSAGTSSASCSASADSAGSSASSEGAAGSSVGSSGTVVCTASATSVSAAGSAATSSASADTGSSVNSITTANAKLNTRFIFLSLSKFSYFSFIFIVPHPYSPCNCIPTFSTFRLISNTFDVQFHGQEKGRAFAKNVRPFQNRSSILSRYIASRTWS